MKKTFKNYKQIFFIGKYFFDNVELQNLLIFQPIYKTFKMPTRITDSVIKWQSKGLWNKKITESYSRKKYFYIIIIIFR